MRTDDFLDFNNLKESNEVEFKEAAGRDKTGGLPDDMWETYSAMANTAGGYIVLGVKENQKNHSFSVSGIQRPEKLRQDFWNTVNNRQKVSCNLLSDKDVTVTEHSGKYIVVIHVPRAGRHDRPVYKGQNPMTGTYLRRNEGDYRCPDHRVRQMLAEQVQDSLDGSICNEFTLADLDERSLKGYRQMFMNRLPNHPFNNEDDVEFLRQLGAYKRDRETGQEGLTLAGLLMFGKLRSILDRLPDYIVDYREYGVSGDSERWIDRMTTDGTWSGNLFDFCQTVLRKLTADFKVPFALKDNARVDETPVHVAVREALVNTLIHADYNGTSAVLVERHPECLKFRNPGNFRIPKEIAITGGTNNSDCRNRNLQKMFQLIGFAEQAGSGFPKIFSGWKTQDWVRPDIREDFELGLTHLILRMESLYPTAMVDRAKNLLGDGYSQLDELERLIVVTVLAETEINHARIAGLTSKHSADITEAFQGLVRLGYLSSLGHGRGTTYHFNEAFVKSAQESLWPVDSSNVSERAIELLRQMVVPMSASELMDLMGMKSPGKFRSSFIKPLEKAGFIQAVFPDKPTHPKQKYFRTDKARNLFSDAD